MKENNLPLAIMVASVLVAGSIFYLGYSISGGSLSFANRGANNGNNNQGQAQNQNQPSAPSQPTNANAKPLKDFADEANLNYDELVSCIKENKFVDEVRKDLSDAGAVGATGTPTIFVGKSTDSGVISGEKIVGAQPFATFSAAIDKLLDGGEPTSPIEVSVDDDPVLGSADAPITIIEFSDYECPFCQRHVQNTYPQLIENYVNDGQVKIVFRDLPLSFHDPLATKEAVAANCARDQGGDEAYFLMHDYIFTNTGTNGAGVPDIKSL